MPVLTVSLCGCFAPRLFYLLCAFQVTGLGRKIGVGKESDVYVGQGPGGEEVVLKFARLGRTSFRSIKRNRDYLQHRKVGVCTRGVARKGEGNEGCLEGRRRNFGQTEEYA